MLKHILRKLFKIKQKDHPQLFDSDAVYFIRKTDGQYEVRNLADGQIREEYIFPEKVASKTQERKSIKQRVIDLLSAPPELTPQQQMREAYFRTRGIRASMKSDLFCPLEASEREMLSYALGGQIPPDHEAQIMLFDTEFDLGEKNAFFRMGYVYDQIHSNTYFNPLISFKAYLVSSNLGDQAASQNIASQFLLGELGEIDYKLASYWFQRAYDQGRLSSLYKQFLCLDKSEYSSPEEFYGARNEFFQRVLAEWRENKKGARTVDSYFFLISYHAQFQNCKPEYSTVYRKIISSDDRKYSRFHNFQACINYSIRLYIGLGIDKDKDQAIRYLQMIPKESNMLAIRNHLYPRAQDLIKLIEEDRCNSEIYMGICKEISDVYEGKAEISELYESLKSANLSHKKIYRNVIRWVFYLSSEENWKTKEEWLSLYKEAAAQANDIALAQVWKSTLIVGPRYNKIGDNSLPILGAWEKASTDMKLAELEREAIGSYVPSAGIRSFNGLRGVNGGSIDWDLSFDSSFPAMLMPEDFDVCLALVFGARDGRIIMPSLSIEELNTRGMQDEAGVICYKEWSPEWLVHTDFGRTLYVTDYLIGQACWYPENFQIGNEGNGVTQQFQAFAKAFVEDMRKTGGYQGDGESSRVMLKPEHIKLNVSSSKIGTHKVWEIAVEETKIRVDGSYILKKDGTENRLVALNDTSFTQGRKVQKLTDRYNDVAALMPVFERARQMSSLLYSLVRLKEEGFTPSHELAQYAQQIPRKYESMDHLPNHQMVFVHPPFPYPYKEVA